MLYQLLSFGRCGHHAVMNWICEQSRPSTYYSNCDIDISEVLNPSKTRNYPTNLDKYRLVILGFINKEIEYIYKYINSIRTILVIRDPYNWIASRIKHEGGVRAKTYKYIPIYKQYLQICLGDIELPIADKSYFTHINYNKWFSSKEYRNEIANKLNIDFTDEGLSCTNHKGKSKFQHHEDDGRNLDVLTRYKEIGVDHYIDKEMIKLSDRYFGDVKKGQ